METRPPELMTPTETARWFRRSPSWLRKQSHLLKLATPGSGARYHVCVCRAFVLGRLCGLTGDALIRLQIRALAVACGIAAARHALPPSDIAIKSLNEIELEQSQCA